jgi:hypothetical protein
MNGATLGIKINQIKSFCVVFPDSCTILNYIFNEEEFKPKVEYFRKMVAKGIPCEVLPKVNGEILRKLINATTEFSDTLRKCKFHSQNIAKQTLNNISITTETAEILEQAFGKIFFESSRKTFSSPEKKSATIRRIRVVETSVMNFFGDIIEKSEVLTLKEFFDKMENDFKNKYTEFCDKQSLFMNELNAVTLKKEDLPETADDLEKILLQSCNVHNKDDRELLCQAIGRMYKVNKWSAVVTTDYSDIVRNRMAIDFKTQLVVSDPLYFIYRLEKKIKCTLHPQDGAVKMKLVWKRLLKSPPNIGVV